MEKRESKRKEREIERDKRQKTNIQRRRSRRMIHKE